MKPFAPRQLFSPIALSLLYTNAAANIIRLNDSVISLVHIVSGFSNTLSTTKKPLKRKRHIGLQKTHLYASNQVAKTKDNTINTIVKIATQQGLLGRETPTTASFSTLTVAGTNAVGQPKSKTRQQSNLSINGLQSINDTASVILKDNVFSASQKTAVIDGLLRKAEPILLNAVNNPANDATISEVVGKTQQMASPPINIGNPDDGLKLQVFNLAQLPIRAPSLLPQKTGEHIIYQQETNPLVSDNERFVSNDDKGVIAKYGSPNKQHNNQPWFIARGEMTGPKYNVASKETATNKHVPRNTEPQRSNARTINFNKSLIEHFTINVSSTKEGITDFKRKVEEVLLEILNSVNTH